jgi:hypothetical protein
MALKSGALAALAIALVGVSLAQSASAQGAQSAAGPPALSAAIVGHVAAPADSVFAHVVRLFKARAEDVDTNTTEKRGCVRTEAFRARGSGMLRFSAAVRADRGGSVVELFGTYQFKGWIPFLSHTGLPNPIVSGYANQEMQRAWEELISVAEKLKLYGLTYPQDGDYYVASELGLAGSSTNCPLPIGR